MRTTLSLEDDLAQQLTEVARESHKPFKVIVNETLRRGLSELGPHQASFRVKAHAGRLRPGIDDRRFNELAWELDEPAPQTPGD